MRLVGNLIIRLITISFGLMLAMIAAGIFVSLGLYNEIVSSEAYSDPDQRDMFAVIALIIGISFTSFVGFYAAGVAGIAIAIAELMRWKGMVTNLLLGGLCGLILTSMATGIDFGSSNLEQNSGSLNPLLVGMSAGFVAGFIYWLIAGRRAGDWMKPAVISE